MRDAILVYFCSSTWAILSCVGGMRMLESNFLE